MKILALAVIGALCALALADPGCFQNPCLGKNVGNAYCRADLQAYFVCTSNEGAYVTMDVPDGTNCQQNGDNIILVHATSTSPRCVGRQNGQYCTQNLRFFFTCPGGQIQPVAPGTRCQQNYPQGASPYVTLVHDPTASNGPAYCNGKAAGQYCTDDFKGYYVCPGGQYQPMAPGTVCAYLSFNPSAVVGVFPRPSSCAAIKSANPSAVDGNYVIYHHGSSSMPINVYCADMNSAPKEFANLAASQSQIWQQNSIRLTTSWVRARLLLDPLIIDSCNLRFTSNTPAGYAGYIGLGVACNCWDTGRAVASVNLAGTNLRFGAGNNVIHFGYGTDSGNILSQSATSFTLSTVFGTGRCMCAWRSSVGSNAADCPSCLRAPNTSDGALIPGLQKCDFFYGVQNDYKALNVEIIPQLGS